MYQTHQHPRAPVLSVAKGRARFEGSQPMGACWLPAPGHSHGVVSGNSLLQPSAERPGPSTDGNDWPSRRDISVVLSWVPLE